MGLVGMRPLVRSLVGESCVYMCIYTHARTHTHTHTHTHAHTHTHTHTFTVPPKPFCASTALLSPAAKIKIQ